uniref:Putative secreted protein n=1 Tax=Amblyomma cajennense TaxID=34607 RepID=A0A023FC68_AMBCJ
MAPLLLPNAELAVFIVVVIFTGAQGSSKTPSGLHYREALMHKFLRRLFNPEPFPLLPGDYFSVRDPFNQSDKATRYRFHLSNGTLVMKGAQAHNTNVHICDFRRNVWEHVFCTLPIAGSFATYKANLSYGRPVVQAFNITSQMEPYGEGWTSPADISANFDLARISGKTHLVLSDVFVTEFLVDTTSSPPFKNFTIFKGNQTLVDKVWHNFTDHIFRKCKQEMRKLMKSEYTKRLKAAAHAVGEIDYRLLWE